MVVTIDGYAGSGKTSASHTLAEALGFELLNTGAMYRAAALELQDRGLVIETIAVDDPRVAEYAATFVFDMDGGVKLGGVDFTGRVRERGSSAAASLVGTFPAVRERLKSEQRRLAAGKNIVCEGRDQGTAVFPEAPLKFFFHATAEVRAERRVAQLLKDGEPAEYAEVLQKIVARDLQDEGRALDPLRRADDAIDIDTTMASEADVLALMLAEAARVMA